MQVRLAMPSLMLLVIFTVIVSTLADNAKYSSKYDDVDVDGILKTPRLRNQYVTCYLEKGPCITPDSKFLKDRLPEAVVTKCQRCTEKQKVFFDKIITWFADNDPDTWNLILEKTIRDYQKS